MGGAALRAKSSYTSHVVHPVLYLAVALGVGFFFYQVLRDLEPGARRRSLRWLLSAAVLLLLGFVLLRFGLHWLALAGAAGGALLRRALPLLLRMAPFAPRAYASWKQQARSNGSSSGSQSHAPPGARGRMTRSEALAVLGLKGDASREQIVSAYKHLMKKVHPDSPGGSDYLASKVNQAKEVLLS